MRFYSTIIFIANLLLILLLTASNPTQIAATNKNPANNIKNDQNQRPLDHLYIKDQTMFGSLSNWMLANYGNHNGPQYDVIIVGSDPEGIIAAIAAAREGQKTLLIDKKMSVGGLFTLGKLNMLDLNRTPSQENLTQGLFLEFYKKINNRTSFDVKQAQRVFEEMLQHEKNITIELGAENILPVMNKNHVESLVYKDKNGIVKKAVGKQYIDSTPDGDFAYHAGANFTIGQEDYRNEQKMMAVTLVFELSEVNWSEVRNYLNKDDKSYTGADEYSAWGYGKEMEQYQSSYKNVRIRALNIGKQNNGNVLINAFQILGVNGLNSCELQEARKIANDELPKITAFIRKNLIGFKNVKLVGPADEFYVRETRHLDAEYKLTINDLLENRDFKDRIAFGSYPIDIQATTLDEGDVIVGNPAQYAIPFRSIVPKGFDNLLVASRSAGYDSLAHGSTRTVPVGMVIGQAAGISSAYANQKNINFQNIVQDSSQQHIANIQITLNRNRANLHQIPLYDNPIVRHWSYSGVKFLRDFALISAGYDNEYELDKPLSQEKFIEYIQKINKYKGSTNSIYLPAPKKNENLTQEDITEFFEKNNLTINILTPLTLNKLKQQQTVSRDVAYMVIKEFFEQRFPVK